MISSSKLIKRFQFGMTSPVSADICLVVTSCNHFACLVGYNDTCDRHLEELQCIRGNLQCFIHVLCIFACEGHHRKSGLGNEASEKNKKKERKKTASFFREMAMASNDAALSSSELVDLCQVVKQLGVALKTISLQSVADIQHFVLTSCVSLRTLESALGLPAGALDDDSDTRLQARASATRFLRTEEKGLRMMLVRHRRSFQVGQQLAPRTERRQLRASQSASSQSATLDDDDTDGTLGEETGGESRGAAALLEFESPVEMIKDMWSQLHPGSAKPSHFGEDPLALLGGIHNAIGQSPDVAIEGQRILPFVGSSLSPAQRQELHRINDQLRNEYQVLQVLLLRRLDVTLQTFLWSQRGQANRSAIEAQVERTRSALQHPLDRQIFEALEARESLLEIRTRTKSSLGQKREVVQSTLIGVVSDRGGRLGGGTRSASSMPFLRPRSRPVKQASTPASSSASQKPRGKRNKRGRVQANFNRK